jgi:NitT/TauT family transport system ATP-binding protein
MTAALSPPALEATGVGYAYPGRTPTQALQDFSLQVRDNEFLAILGPVGCGKTTLLRIFAGFLRPTTGSVRCAGAPIEGPGWQRGYVLQEQSIFPWMTVRENIEFGLLAKGVEPSARRAVSDELIKLIGLPAFEGAYPRELSAGMSKMVEVARVLATDPSLLLLDEPFGALDSQTRTRMQDALARLWEQKRKTVVFVTHDVEESLYLADRIVVLSERPGRIKAQFAVDLPRPRSLETRFSAGLLALKRQVWDATGR